MCAPCPSPVLNKIMMKHCLPFKTFDLFERSGSISKKQNKKKRPQPEAIKIQTYGTSCKYCHVEKAFSFFCSFRVRTRKLHYKKQLCTVQYTTASKGEEDVSMGANSASNFLRKENKKR